MVNSELTPVGHRIDNKSHGGLNGQVLPVFSSITFKILRILPLLVVEFEVQGPDEVRCDRTHCADRNPDPLSASSSARTDASLGNEKQRLDADRQS